MHAHAQADNKASRRSPPLSSTRFAHELQHKRFTNGADAAVVAELYRRCLHDGLGGATQLVYPRMGWRDADIAELGAMLVEVVCPRLTLLKLSVSPFTTLAPIGSAWAAGATPHLRTLVLAACTGLTSVPASIGELAHLETLVLSDCHVLTALPKELCAAGASGRRGRGLRLLDLRGHPDAASLVPPCLGQGCRVLQNGLGTQSHTKSGRKTRTSLPMSMKGEGDQRRTRLPSTPTQSERAPLDEWRAGTPGSNASIAMGADV